MTVSHITATPCDLQGVSGKNSLVFVKQGNVLYISPDGRAQTPPEVFSLLHNHLSYDYKEFLYGWRARDQHTGKKRRIEVTQRRMYGTDQAGRLFTPFGFMRRCYNVLKSAGYAISYVDWNQHYESNHPRPKRYEPRWENVSRHFTYRLRQEECLTNISKSQCGVVHAVTGFGKMVIVAMICLLYPKAKIHVITRRVPLVNKLVEFLTRHIPNVGQFGDGQKRFGDRVTVFTCKSLSHSDFDADIVIGDEAHELVTDDTSILLSRYQGCRMFGLTATPTGRSDGSDTRLEAYFGPTIFYLPYWEAAALGLVVPIRVEWSDVILDHNPAAGYEDVERKRHGIWFNAARNDIIARDLLAVPKDDQLLVLTDTIFHAVQIYERIRDKREREPVLVYDKIDIERFKKYKDHGILPKDLSRMTADKKEELRRRFEAGEIDAISTTTWEVGIDPIYLQHLFIASSFSSEIKAQQAPGRATRVNTEGKELGIVRDYRDQFDDGFRRAAGERSRIYGSMRWEQVVRRGDELIPVKP